MDCKDVESTVNLIWKFELKLKEKNLKKFKKSFLCLKTLLLNTDQISTLEKCLTVLYIADF